MSQRRILPVLVVLLALAVATSCGGVGQGLRTPSNPLVVQTTSLPDMVSGDAVNIPIELSGGCNGKYVLSVISGRMPLGVGLDDGRGEFWSDFNNNGRYDQGEPFTDANGNGRWDDDYQRHHIVGTLLEASPNPFTFMVQIVDTSCEPFAETTQAFSWTITVGPLKVVGSNPAWVPAGATPENPNYDALPPVVFSVFSNIRLLIAGGRAPYHCELWDRPGITETGLPQGVILSQESCTFVGSPGQAGPPFIISLRVTDAENHEIFWTGQWKITTPPVVIATTTLAGGQAGVAYADGVTVADGVAPYTHALVKTAVNYVPDPNGDPGDVIPDVVYDQVNVPRLPPTVNPATAAQIIDGTFYPPQTDDVGGSRNYATAYDGRPPEGLFVDELGGTLSGIPRRVGTFRIHWLVRSKLVPNESGQHGWGDYTFAITTSSALSHNPAYTLNTSFPTMQPYATIAEAQVGVPYDPDNAVDPFPGLKIRGQGGVGHDGKTDAPHKSQVMDIEGRGPGFEVVGDYAFAVDYDPDNNGVTYAGNSHTTPPPQMGFDTDTGNFFVAGSAANLQRQGFQEIGFTILDDQLPLTSRNTRQEKVNFAIGPDLVVFTESTSSSTATTNGATPDYNDGGQKVRILEPRATSPITRDLNAAGNNDMVATHSVPTTASTTDLQTLLTSMDILRVAVNPTSWMDDPFSLNAGGARTGQHGDPNRYYNYWSDYGYAYYNNNIEPSSTSVHIPDCTTDVMAVPHAPASGIYRDGGKLYAFESANDLGVMIIREDSKIYVPFAFSKSSSPYRSFGDAMHNPYATASRASTRIAQMAVSVDGRFATMKLKTTFGSSSFNERAATTKIILFSLTGEKLWNGGTTPYKVVNTGSTASGSLQGGLYMYAGSMCMNADYLYYLCGDYTGRNSSWRDHYIYRYDLDGDGASGALMTGFNSILGGSANTASVPMQTPFHIFDNTTGFISTTSFATGTLTFIAGPYPATHSDELYMRDGANVMENSLAPVPFRASADGRAMAILAGARSTSTNSTTVMSHYPWVDFQGTLYRLSTTQRHSPHGAGRAGSLARGPSWYFHWGARTGPSGAFEISDDGLKVAAVVSRDGTINGGPNNTDDSNSNWDVREDIIAWRATNAGTGWSSGSTELQVTGADSGSTMVFDNSPTDYRWRFGALHFTRDGNGLVFWGGYSGKNATGTNLDFCWTCTGLYPNWSSTSQFWDNFSVNYFGTLYSYNFANGQVRSLLATNDGGGSAGKAAYSTSSQVAPSTSAWSGAQGKLQPIGSFVSKDGNFMFMTTWGPLNTSDQTNTKLVAVNIRSLDGQVSGTPSINGHADGDGFAVGNWPTRYGFLPSYYYLTYYWMEYRFYAPGHMNGMGGQVMAKDSGRVFWQSHYQASGPTQSTGSGSTFSNGPIHPTYWGDYASYGGHVMGMDANIGGPVQQLTTATLGSNTTYRPITFVEASNSGKSVAFVYTANSTIRYYYTESLGYVGNIDFGPTGNLLSGSFMGILTSSQGRVGDSMAHDFTGTKLYWSFVAGSTNENQKQIYETSFSPTGSMTTRPVAATAKRYNVLHSGR